MKILIAAATAFEIGPFVDKLAEAGNRRHHEFLICLTGIGMMHAAHAITRSVLSFKPEMAIQAGVAGAFDSGLQLGEIVLVAAECQGDLGIEDRAAYLDIFETGLVAPDHFPYTGASLANPMTNIFIGKELRQVKGLTVNKVSGSSDTIDLRRDKYGCAVESMEGAAFHYVCLQEEVPFLQLRAISNYVEPRDKSRWQMKTAITNLNDYLIAGLL